MSNPDLPTVNIVECGTEIYERRLRHVLEPQHNGKYVVIDVETGEYEVDENHLAASDRAAAKRPGAPLYATRRRLAITWASRWPAVPNKPC
jgi:2-succinyl-5-enolpyruvyl-6-hydroxy-3-cyclohexene-1-carboxylate synthase